jgi:hypothetical protein
MTTLLACFPLPLYAAWSACIALLTLVIAVATVATLVVRSAPIIVALIFRIFEGTSRLSTACSHGCQSKNVLFNLGELLVAVTIFRSLDCHYSNRYLALVGIFSFVAPLLVCAPVPIIGAMRICLLTVGVCQSAFILAIAREILPRDAKSWSCRTPSSFSYSCDAYENPYHLADLVLLRGPIFRIGLLVHATRTDGCAAFRLLDQQTLRVARRVSFPFSA